MGKTKKLSAYVHVTDRDGGNVVLKPGDTVPAWATKQVTNPKVFASDDEQSDNAGDGGPDVEVPPKGGEGSGIDAWRAYAEAKDVAVDPSADRDAIIAALEAAGVPTEKQ